MIHRNVKSGYVGENVNTEGDFIILVGEETWQASCVMTRQQVREHIERLERLLERDAMRQLMEEWHAAQGNSDQNDFSGE